MRRAPAQRLAPGVHSHGCGQGQGYQRHGAGNPASSQARRLFSLLWSTEAPAYTALPLVTLALPSWRASGSLSNKIPAAKDEGHEIATHSWEKVEEALIIDQVEEEVGRQV